MKKFLSYIPVIGYFYLTVYYFTRWELPFKTNEFKFTYWGLYQVACIAITGLIVIVLKNQ